MHRHGVLVVGVGKPVAFAEAAHRLAVVVGADRAPAVEVVRLALMVFVAGVRDHHRNGYKTYCQLDSVDHSDCNKSYLYSSKKPPI